jgi:hypothetical protein
MTSRKKRATSQANGSKSRGPKTKTGKTRSSQNALRHGLSVVNRHHPAHGGEIRRTAEAICEGDTEGPWFGPAVVIAECQLVLRCIEMEKAFRIERLRDSSTYPFSTPVLVGALHKLRRSCIEFREIKARLIAAEKTKSQRPPRKAKPDRSELAALRLAMPDLVPLERYERRAWSRQKRAIKEFISLKSRAIDQPPEQ